MTVTLSALNNGVEVHLLPYMTSLSVNGAAFLDQKVCVFSFKGYCARGECLLACTYYISPEAQPTGFKGTLNSIDTTVTSHSDYHLLITGDFNAPKISWETQLINQASQPISHMCDILLMMIGLLWRKAD